MRTAIAQLAFVACATLVSAQGCVQTADTSKNPSGNPIAKPGLTEIVPAGTPYTINWNPTTDGSVSIALLQGPATNVLPIGCIVDNIPNTGKFVWTPSTSLVPGATGYGIQIIVSGTGQYQYSTQFGISNPNVASSAVPYVPASQASDGQPQVPTTSGTSTAEAKSQTISTYPLTKATGYAPSASGYAPSGSGYAPSGSGYAPSTSKYGTAYSSGHSYSNASSASSSKSANASSQSVSPSIVLPSIVTGTAGTATAANSSTTFVSPTLAPSVPSSLQPYVSVQQTSGAPSGGSTPAASNSPAPAAGACVRATAGALVAGLGVVAALVL